jgi:hypothetical protein
MSIELLMLGFRQRRSRQAVELRNERGPAVARGDRTSSVGRRKANALDERAVAWVGVKEVIGGVGLDVKQVRGSLAVAFFKKR